MTTKKEEDEIITHWQQGRRFDVRNTKDWLDLVIKTFAVGALVATATTFAVKTLAPGWAEIPATLQALSLEVGALRQQIEIQAPQVIEFKGGIVAPDPTVAQGESITLSTVLRRNVGCDTLINVRFFDHSNNTISARYSYTTPSVRSPVTRQFSPFSLQVFVPEDLPVGTYSYLPEILPQDCGVYQAIVTPMSDPFKVTEATGG